MAKFRRKRTLSPDIPTASMADIAFLLIIFFMLTAVFTSNQGIRFSYPEDDPEDTNVQPKEAVHIKVEGEGLFRVDRTMMSYDQMAGYLQAKMAEAPDKPVIIQTLPDVPYSVMIDVFDLLRQLEVKNISIPTKTEIERWKAFGVFE